MTYTRSAVYDSVRNFVADAHPTAYITSRFVAKPPSFPAVLIREIDRNRPIQNVQLDFEDVQWESVFEAQVASAKANMAASEAYDIMDAVRQAFSNLYYREFSETSIDKGDTYTIIGRFRRVIGGGDTMPSNS
jgi:hypothetical protein